VAAALLVAWLCGAHPVAAPALVGRAAVAGLPDIDDLPDGPRPPPLSLEAAPASAKQIWEIAGLVWAALGVMMGGLWVSKGRSFGQGLLAGLFMGPVFSFFVYRRLEPAFEQAERRDLAGLGASSVCPYCAAVLEAGEMLCPSCGKLMPG